MKPGGEHVYSVRGLKLSMQPSFGDLSKVRNPIVVAGSVGELPWELKFPILLGNSVSCLDQYVDPNPDNALKL